MIDHIRQNAAKAIGGKPTVRRKLARVLGLASSITDPEAIAILEAGLFDADFYLATYPDVGAAGFDPLRHYIECGDEEGRWPNAFFDPPFYRRQFSSVGRWPFSTLYHYATIGENAGLQPSAAFNKVRYLACNAELGPWVDRPLAHFLWIGRDKGWSSTHRLGLPADQKVVLQRAPSRPRSLDGLIRGVNVVGPLDRVAGLGVSTRGYLAAVTEAGFGPVGARVLRREFAAQSPGGGLTAFPAFRPDAAINLVHVGGDTLPHMINSGEGALLAGRYNIGIWYWELPTLRPEWQALMEHFDAFWAPTPFIARILSQSTAKPVRLVPPYLPYLNRLEPRRPPDGRAAHFIYCFDANSIIERKNPALLLDAFLEAFRRHSDARLTFKVTYPNRRIPELERLYAVAKEKPNVQIIDHLLTDAEIHQLMASATAYVSPHRSEGLGLTLVEAMALGVPVISTPFSGVADFVTPQTAWPIDYKLVALTDDHGPYPRGFVWADPDLDSLIEAMVSVASDPAGARERALSGRERVRELFASSNLIHAVRRELEVAAATIGL
ncbi:MAG TPA: glycosyltransferase [Caulobacteraceae bacterium]|nr:glycosyltransferase [Caulobacteraceae bacterium]